MLLFLCAVASKLATGMATMDTDAALVSYVHSNSIIGRLVPDFSHDTI